MENKNNEIKLNPLPGLWSNINTGFFITLLVIGFMAVVIWSKINTVHLSSYEVVDGSLMPQLEYTGLILRDEQVITAGEAGTFYRYAREGERVAKNHLVYIIDKSGSIKEYLKNTELEGIDDAPDYAGLRSEINGFNKSFSPQNFGDIYDLYYNLQGLAQSNAARILEGAGERIRAAAGSAEFGYAAQSGIVVYQCDGYEQTDLENLSYGDLEILESKAILEPPVTDETPVEPGQGVYKLVLSENWYIIISVDKKTYDTLMNKGVVNVTFPKNGHNFLATVADTGLAPVMDVYMITLALDDGMSLLAAERVIEVELDIEQTTGLKIPQSAILTADFFTIPKDFVADAGGDVKFVYTDRVDENGKQVIGEQVISIYSVDDDYYFTDDTILKSGDIITTNGKTYRIGETKTLTGVFNVNRGFAEFKEIKILDADDIYAIVSSNTKYGLRVHDHIALKGAEVKEGELIKKQKTLHIVP